MYFSGSASGTLVVSQTDSENLSVLSVRSGSLNGHLRTNMFRDGYANAARIRSRPSRRRSSWSTPHPMGCPVCGVIRVGFQHPNRGDGSSSSNRSPKASIPSLISCCSAPGSSWYSPWCHFTMNRWAAERTPPAVYQFRVVVVVTTELAFL